MFNIAKKLGWETLWDSVKFTLDSTFVDALGPRDPIEIKPKSNTEFSYYIFQRVNNDTVQTVGMIRIFIVPMDKIHFACLLFSFLDSVPWPLAKLQFKKNTQHTQFYPPTEASKKEFWL